MSHQNLPLAFVLAMIVWLMPVLLLMIVVIAAVLPVISRSKTKAILGTQALMSSLATSIAKFFEKGRSYLE